jgi:hypothetical protein
MYKTKYIYYSMNLRNTFLLIFVARGGTLLPVVVTKWRITEIDYKRNKNQKYKQQMKGKESKE